MKNKSSLRLTDANVEAVNRFAIAFEKRFGYKRSAASIANQAVKEWIEKHERKQKT